ncbi:MAG: helix-turn-helix transcriptional regulator [Treponema sp.]
MLDFWVRVKELLKVKNITQDKIAAQINERADSFSRWIQKDRLPDALQTYKIAQALNVSIEYLVTGKEPENAEKIAAVKEQLLEVVQQLDQLH